MENKERFTTQRASVPRGVRTLDSYIKSVVLYQLSYEHIKCAGRKPKSGPKSANWSATWSFLTHTL